MYIDVGDKKNAENKGSCGWVYAEMLMIRGVQWKALEPLAIEKALERRLGRGDDRSTVGIIRVQKRWLVLIRVVIAGDFLNSIENYSHSSPLRQKKKISYLVEEEYSLFSALSHLPFKRRAVLALFFVF